jgi:hypothetical protein
VLVGVFFAAFGPARTTNSKASGPLGNKVLAHAVDVYLGRATLGPHEMPVSSGPVAAAVEALQPAAAERVPQGRPNARPDTQGCQNIRVAGEGRPDNIRVNQDCSFRRQAEEVIAVNPRDPKNLVAGQNDSRLGYNHCGYDWSYDGGRTWGDMVPPFYQYVMADDHTADACSDPTATFDAEGNAYVGGVLFDINSAASSFIVMKSNAPIGGAFYHNPGADPFQVYRTANPGVIASNNDPSIFHDKELITADQNKDSSKASNVYGTWTRFGPDGSPIYFSQSTDGGATWSPGIEISGSGSFCGGRCGNDQGSQPTVGRDGTVYVSFANGDTRDLQVLLVKCPASADCSKASSWQGPFKVSDQFSGPGKLPPNGYRTPEVTSISNSVDDSGNLYVSWMDFRNGGPPCTSGQPPCDMDILYSVSKDGGMTWGAPVNVTPKSKFGATAQWQPWSAVTPDGKTLFVAYYDRSNGKCEFSGCNDITAAMISDPAGTGNPVQYLRVTTQSMPNLTSANNPVQAGFLGDYMGVATDRRGRAHIVWADTSGLRGAVEEDIYYATLR